tara:strand:- start:222 stop:404 length:183 start_codon:yes stop_codon:yes gene_type:complete
MPDNVASLILGTCNPIEEPNSRCGHAVGFKTAIDLDGLFGQHGFTVEHEQPEKEIDLSSL